MKLNYLITHQDIAKLGYYFLDKGQENAFLGHLNDEFAKRIGTSLFEQLKKDGHMSDAYVSPKEIREFFFEKNSEAESVIEDIRSQILKDVKEERKSLLGVEQTLRFRAREN